MKLLWLVYETSLARSVGSLCVLESSLARSDATEKSTQIKRYIHSARVQLKGRFASARLILWMQELFSFEEPGSKAL